MIKRLEIENFILIEHQIIDFNQPINVLTGDTGSGKSVIINSIRFALGMRANSELYLDHTKPIKVTINMTVNQALAIKLDQHEIDYDEEIEIMRALSANGKNKIRINGELISVHAIQDIFEDIITIYSQYSVAKFKTDSSYLEIIDNLAINDQQNERYAVEYKKYHQLRVELKALERSALLKGEKQELLELRLTDLKAVDNDVDLEQLICEKQELDKLAASSELNSRASKEFEAASLALNNLLDTVELDSHLTLLNDALINIDEVSFEIAKASQPVDQNRLETITEYISMCRRLARKYNVEIDKLGEYKQQLSAEYSELDSIDADIENTNNKLAKQYQITLDLANQLSQLRQQIIPDFTSEVNQKLKQLSLTESDFRVVLTQGELTASGHDLCSFEVKMNSGGQYTQIHKTASGGEIARFLLALEAVSSSRLHGSFIIFDEIDTGVSGHVATEMANMMKSISHNHKVLIVTHLAQVAAISQNHFMISKQTIDGLTTSSAKLLTSDEKPLVLAKMISGAKTNEMAIAHAETLLGHK